MNKSTRSLDLDYLDSKRRDRQQEGSKETVEANLAAVYEQMKDPYLESMRMKLIDCLKKLEDLAGNGTPLEKMLAYQEYTGIQKKIMKYTSRPEWRARIALKIQQATNTEQAEKFFFQGKEVKK